jgi:hypothetical protein
MPVPTTADVEALSANIPHDIAALYLPHDPDRALPRIWNCLMETTFALGRILKTHYRVRPLDGDIRPPASVLVEQNRADMIKCRSRFPSEDEFDTCSPVIMSHLYHLYIYYEYEKSPTPSSNISLHVLSSLAPEPP